MPCTTLLVGKLATYDGSTFAARNEDSGAGSYTAKKFIVVKPEDQPEVYRSVISHVEIPLPEAPMRYTCMPNAVFLVRSRNRMMTPSAIYMGTGSPKMYPPLIL